MNRFSLTTGFCAASLFVTGCQLATSDVDAELRVDLLDGKLRALAYLHDSNDFAEVIDDAHVVATFRGRDIDLRYDGAGFFFDQGSYEALIDLDEPLVTDEPFTFAVSRDGETDAPSSTVTVPPLPDLAPLPLFISRAKPLTVSWSTITDDVMTWKLDSFCAEGSGEIPPGVGSLTIPAMPTRVPGLERTCTASLTIDRKRVAAVDPAFAGGSVRFYREIVIEFASTP
jgi:hypothetical protein